MDSTALAALADRDALDECIARQWAPPVLVPAPSRSDNSQNGRTSPVDFSRNVVCVMGLPFDTLTMPEAAERVRAAVLHRTPLLISTANLNFVVTSRNDEAFRESIIHSQLSLADGMPVIWIARLLGLPILERVTGSGLFEAISRNIGIPAVKVFFFGGPEGVAETASERVNRQGGGISCVGFDFPGYVPVEAMSGAGVTQRINATDPDFVVVSLGAKKGQAWIERNRAGLSAPVICHLGAVVNFAAGVVRRAPQWMQRMGLEWAWRIKEEPSLWKRYASDGAVFLQIIATNVVPLLWQRVCIHLVAKSCPTTVELRTSDTSVHLKLSGSFDGGNTGPLRAALSEAASRGTRVRLDLSEAVHMDATAMGLILLLHGHQRDIDRPLELTKVSSALRRQFRYHGTSFLLAADAEPLMHLQDTHHSRA